MEKGVLLEFGFLVNNRGRVFCAQFGCEAQASRYVTDRVTNRSCQRVKKNH